MIYFAQAIDGGPIKIGYSANVDSRIRQLESIYRQPLSVLATMPGDRDEERAIHERFAHWRMGRTEQFQPGHDLMEFIGRPLFVNASPVEPMTTSDERVAIIHLKGSQEYSAWLEEVHKKSHISKASIFRVAVMEWAQRNGYRTPPEL